MDSNYECNQEISDGSGTSGADQQSSSKRWSDSDDWSRARVKSILTAKGYNVGRCIGLGSYSKVYQAFRPAKFAKIPGKNTLAFKLIDRRQTANNYDRLLPREITAMLTLSHPHIVSVQSIQEYGPFVCIFMDYCRQGDLLEYVQQKKRLTERRTRLFFHQLVQAVQYMHREGFCHRDIKCENILLAGPSHVKLTDFTFAKQCAPPHGQGAVELSTTFCGSLAYTAPEVLQGIPYDPKAHDMWSLGCVLFVMFTGSMPFDESKLRETLEHQRRKQYAYPADLKPKPSIMELIDRLIEPDVTVRATIGQVADDPWVSQL